MVVLHLNELETTGEHAVAGWVIFDGKIMVWWHKVKRRKGVASVRLGKVDRLNVPIGVPLYLHGNIHIKFFGSHESMCSQFYNHSPESIVLFCFQSSEYLQLYPKPTLSLLSWTIPTKLCQRWVNYRVLVSLRPDLTNPTRSQPMKVKSFKSWKIMLFLTPLKKSFSNCIYDTRMGFQIWYFAINRKTLAGFISEHLS